MKGKEKGVPSTVEAWPRSAVEGGVGVVSAADRAEDEDGGWEAVVDLEGGLGSG